MGTTIVDLSVASPQLPREMCAFLAAGAEALAAAKQAVGGTSGRVALKDVKLEVPILRPPKILAVGLNYKDHIAETGNKTPEVPMIFNKQSTSVNRSAVTSICRARLSSSTMKENLRW